MIITRVYRPYLRAFLRTTIAQKDFYLHTDCAAHKPFSFISKLKAFRAKKPEASHVESGMDEEDQSKSLLEFSPENVQLPLSDVNTRIERLVRDEFGEQLDDLTKWHVCDITDVAVKFKVVQKCHQEFGVTIPNNKLHSMKSVHDLVDYYNLLQPEETQTSFQSIDVAGLPNNLTIN